MRYKKLSEIAEVQSGLVLSRKKAKHDLERPTEYMKLNLRSINEDGSIDKRSLERYYANGKLEEQFVTSKGDIIVRLFAPFRPALIAEPFVGLVVPSQFAIVRLKSDDVTPEFLCCYLSRRNLLESLAIRGSGQISGGIKISAMAEMKIPLLAIDKQNAIASYSEINARQKQLYLDIIQQYELQLDAVINRAIGGE